MPKARLSLAVAIAAAVLGAGAGTAHAEQSAVPAGSTLTLVGVEATNTYSPANWAVDTAGKTMVGTFYYGTGTYRYNLPAVIPPGGAQGSLVMNIQATQLWATGFSLEGPADFSPPPAINEVTSERGLSFSHTLTFTIKPRAYSAGTKFVEFIGKAYYGEGPRFTFRYAVKAKPKPGMCRRVARSTAALSSAAAGTAFCGVTLRVDSPKGVASPWLEVKKRVDLTAAATGMDVEAPLRLAIRWRDPDAPSHGFKEFNVGCVTGRATCHFWASSDFPRALEFQAVLMLDSDELYRSDVVHARWVPELKKLSFDYTVPPRLEQKKAGDPVAYVNGGAKSQPDSWPVDITVTKCPDPAKHTYDWEYTPPNEPGKVLALPATRSSGCTWRAKLPGPGKGAVEGRFHVTLKVDAHVGLQKYEGNRAVLLQDFLVVGMGDSLGSGEGNPESGTGAGAKWQNEQCDRSSLSYQALAALAIERADEKTSVTFVHLACSGALITDHTTTGTKGGLLAPYAGINPKSPPLISQLAAATKAIEKREVDAILLSAGVNDLEFGNVIGQCAHPVSSTIDEHGRPIDCFDRPFTDAAGVEHASLRAFMQQRIGELPALYQTLKAALQAFDTTNLVPSKRVFITEYPDTLRNGQLQLCPGLDLSAQTGSVVGITAGEVDHLANELRAPLNAAIAATGGTAPTAWTVVGLGGGFEPHGYCAADSWVVRRIESFRDQGNENGTLHPNNEGHRWIGTAVAKALKAQLLPGGKPRKPR